MPSRTKPKASPTPPSTPPATPRAQPGTGLGRIAREELSCAQVQSALNEHLAGLCHDKANSLPHCDHEGEAAAGCGCGEGQASHGSGMVDLIVLVSTNQTMAPLLPLLSETLKKAIQEAPARCGVDLRVTALGVDGSWPGTAFSSSHRTYLNALSAGLLATDNPVGGADREEGANAIEDLSKHANWRPGACRTIFYISDRELDGNTPVGDSTNEVNATTAAALAAQAHQVTVSAQYIPRPGNGPLTQATYNHLCQDTGGTLYPPLPLVPSTAPEYVAMFIDVVCAGCAAKCRHVEWPAVQPCISVSWGDSKCDCLESDDLEVMCITVCNCYDNITFSGLSISAIVVTDPTGAPIGTLPDGGASIEVLPVGPFCFGDIPPCVDGQPGCVSRQVVLRTRGARSGPYQLSVLGVCYDVTTHHDMKACFTLSICKD